MQSFPTTDQLPDWNMQHTVNPSGVVDHSSIPASFDIHESSSMIDSLQGKKKHVFIIKENWMTSLASITSFNSMFSQTPYQIRNSSRVLRRNRHTVLRCFPAVVLPKPAVWNHDVHFSLFIIDQENGGPESLWLQKKMSLWQNRQDIITITTMCSLEA